MGPGTDGPLFRPDMETDKVLYIFHICAEMDLPGRDHVHRPDMVTDKTLFIYSIYAQETRPRSDGRTAPGPDRRRPWLDGRRPPWEIWTGYQGRNQEQTAAARCGKFPENFFLRPLDRFHPRATMATHRARERHRPGGQRTAPLQRASPQHSPGRAARPPPPPELGRADLRIRSNFSAFHPPCKHRTAAPFRRKETDGFHRGRAGVIPAASPRKHSTPRAIPSKPPQPLHLDK